MTQKIILITGCSTGIGYNAAELLKERGHRVIATARKFEDVARLENMGFESLQLDLADSSSIQNAVTAMLKLTNGRCDAVFHL